MVFNIQKFLTENKLTGQSQMREDDNTGLVMPTGGEDEEFGDDDDLEDTDDWNKPDYDDAADQYEKEPTTKDVQSEPSTSEVQKKQIELRSLEDKKDSLLMQLKSNIITLDQYKEQIGNIPAQIKKLRADLDKTISLSDDDDEYAEEM